MATRLSRYLKLRIDDSLSSDSIYNLERLDNLASLQITSSDNTTTFRSPGDISFSPNDQELSGSGIGGKITLGNESSQVIINGELSLFDQNINSTNNLNIKYLPTTIPSEDYSLSLDLLGSDSTLSIEKDITFSGESLSISSPIITDLTLPATLGSSGNVLSTDGYGNLSWVSVSGVGVTDLSINWLPAEGTNLIINHGFGSRNIRVDILDIDDNYADIQPDTITRPTDNTVEITIPTAPSGSGFQVLVSKLTI